MRKINYLMCLMTLPLMSANANAASAWAYGEGVSSLSYSFVFEGYNEKWLGSDSRTPIANIDQQTQLLTAKTGLTDKTTLGLQTGYTRSHWDNSDYEYGGIADSSISADYQWLNQYIDGTWSNITIHTAINIAGNYQRGGFRRPHSPGDKANGFEASFISGKFLSNRWSSQVELGYRYRDNDVPDDFIFNFGFNYNANESWNVSLNGVSTFGLSGIDINDADFNANGSNFHETKEHKMILEIAASYASPDGSGFTIGTARSVYGQNAPVSKIGYIALSISF